MYYTLRYYYANVTGRFRSCLTYGSGTDQWGNDYRHYRDNEHCHTPEAEARLAEAQLQRYLPDAKQELDRLMANAIHRSGPIDARINWTRSRWGQTYHKYSGYRARGYWDDRPGHLETALHAAVDAYIEAGKLQRDNRYHAPRGSYRVVTPELLTQQRRDAAEAASAKDRRERINAYDQQLYHTLKALGCPSITDASYWQADGDLRLEGSPELAEWILTEIGSPLPSKPADYGDPDDE